MSVFFLKKSLAFLWGMVFDKNLPKGALDVRVLCYHSVNPESNNECDPIAPSLFEKHIRHIVGKYHPVCVQDVIDHINHNTPLPKKAVLITFDDGYQDNLTYAYPILRKYNCPAIIFLATHFTGGKLKLIDEQGWEAMTWIQVKDLIKDNLIDIGAHTRTHRILSKIDTGEVGSEILGSVEDIELNIQRKVKAFAFPNGRLADIPISALKYISESDVELSFSTTWRSWSFKKNRYLLNRIMITGGDTLEVLDMKLKGYFDYIYLVHVSKWALTKKFFKE